MRSELYSREEYRCSEGGTPLPKLTWASLAKVPPVVVGMAAAMSGIYFIIGRRMKLQALTELEQLAASEESDPPAPTPADVSMAENNEPLVGRTEDEHD